MQRTECQELGLHYRCLSNRLQLKDKLVSTIDWPDKLCTYLVNGESVIQPPVPIPTSKSHCQNVVLSQRQVLGGLQSNWN